MTPQSTSDASTAGGFLSKAAAYGVATPRPGLLLWVLMLLAACIVVLTAIDLASMPAQIDAVTRVAKTKEVSAGAMRSGLITNSLFITAVMCAVLALIAFGHNWARWVWMIVCVLFGSLAALGTLVLMFSYAPAAAAVKCAIYLVILVLSCMLFAPSGNAWFRQIKAIRNNPRLDPAYRGADPATSSTAAAEATAAGGQPHDPYAPPGGMPATRPPAPPIPPRPRPVLLALALFVLNAITGTVLTAVYLSDLLEVQSALLGESMMTAILGGGMAVGLLLMAVILYFVWRGSNAGRWTWTVMTIIGLLNAYSAVKMAFGISPVYGGLLTLSQLISLGGTILLFVPASASWFRQVSLERDR